mmetsp:Transcript_18414/g.29926  ORF Transcript_18414/g.29926 Transcript_18414/m.29926 type:complete len:231 (-) Transcript_18414:9-701(-)
MAVKDTHFHNRTEVTRLHAQRGVAHVRGFLTKDGAQKFFFRRHWALALWCDLTNQNVARLYVRTDVHDASLVEVTQRFFTDVWNVAGDFFWTQLGVTCGNFEFFDMNRSKHVVTRDALGDQDGVFVVVTVPRHKRDNHVFTQSQFTDIGGWTVGNHFALGNRVTHFHQRTLVDAGVLVGPLELAHAVNVDTRITQLKVGRGADHDPCGVNLVDDPGTFGHDGRAGVARHK